MLWYILMWGYICFYMFRRKYTKYVEKSEVITSSTHSFAYVVRHHVTRIKSEIILMAQEARKTLGKLNFKLSIISFFGGGGKVIGKLYIDLKHRIWRVQICQKEKYCFFDIIWLRGDAPHIFILTNQEMYWWKVLNFIISYLSSFNPILIKFSLFCWINLNLDWI